MIDIKLFKETFTEIEAKLQKIRVLPMIRPQEQDYVGFSIDRDCFEIESEYYYSGCGTDSSYLEIPIDEINNSVEWFKEKFQKEIDEKNRMEKELKLEKEREKKQRYERLKQDKLTADLETYRRIKKQLEKNEIKL